MSSSAAPWLEPSSEVDSLSEVESSRRGPANALRPLVSTLGFVACLALVVLVGRGSFGSCDRKESPQNFQLSRDSVLIKANVGDIEEHKLGSASTQTFIQRLALKNYGVLGSGEATNGALVSPPGLETAIVDPAGLQIIQQGAPKDAGGAAGAIYKWLGISEFPTELVSGLHHDGDAVFVSYGRGRAVIHVASPSLLDAPDTSDALARLEKAYHSVLEQFLRRRELSTLRLLPISGGIFAGSFKSELPMMTYQALAHAFQHLSVAEQNALQEKTVEMCLWSQEEFGNYMAAYKKASHTAAR